MGLGAECDEAYVIDAETNNYLYCFEGHKNYISAIIFDEVNIDENDQLDEVEVNNNLNMSVMETLTNDNVSNTNLRVKNIFINNKFIRIQFILSILTLVIIAINILQRKFLVRN